MKKLIISFFILGSSFSFASATIPTDMSSKWICTTDASGTNATADKAADDKMANTSDSAIKAFTFAAENCRDCSKITCEVKE